jgi:hypothetical protein
MGGMIAAEMSTQSDGAIGGVAGLTILMWA